MTMLARLEEILSPNAAEREKQRLRPDRQAWLRHAADTLNPAGETARRMGPRFTPEEFEQLIAEIEQVST